MTTDAAQDTMRKATIAIEHYRRLLAGAGLTAADQRVARIGIVHFVAVRFRARAIVAQSREVAYEVVR